MESFEHDGTYIGMLRNLTTILSICQEHAEKMPRRWRENAKETLRITWKCNNKQHKHPVPAKHEEEALKYMESLENNGTYVGMLRKLTAIRSKCQENAKKMPRKCQGLPRKCQEHA